MFKLLECHCTFDYRKNLCETKSDQLLQLTKIILRANVICLSLLEKFGCPSKYLTMIVQLTGRSDVAVISPNIYQHKWFTSKTLCCPCSYATVFNSFYVETNYRGNELLVQHIYLHVQKWQCIQLKVSQGPH